MAKQPTSEIFMNCKICNTPTTPIYDRQFDINYYHCSNCDYIFLNPGNIVSEQEELQLYQIHQNTPDNIGYVKMFKDFINQTILPYKANIKSVLEFGAGPGPVLADLLKENNFDVDVYDPYFFPEKVYQNKTYDLITSTEVFEHLKDPLETLELLYNCLNTGGIISIMTLYHPQDSEIFKGWWYRRESTHISFYSHQTMRHLAKRFGLQILLLTPKNLCVMQKHNGPDRT
jgi:SAM-dependent methyltransferase